MMGADKVPIDEPSRLERLRQQYESEKESQEPTGAIDAELVHDLLDFIVRARQRFVELEQRVDDVEAAAHKAQVVDELPDNAPLGTLFRVRGDLTGALYLGNGGSRPLSKLLPAAL